MGALTPRNLGHGCYDNCEPSGNYGRVLSYPTGDPTRASSPHGNPAHFGQTVRSNLHPCGELVPVCCCDGSSLDFWDLEQAGERLWHCRDRRHGGDFELSFSCILEMLEMVHLARPCCHCATGRN